MEKKWRGLTFRLMIYQGTVLTWPVRKVTDFRAFWITHFLKSTNAALQTLQINTSPDQLFCSSFTGQHHFVCETVCHKDGGQKVIFQFRINQMSQLKFLVLVTITSYLFFLFDLYVEEFITSVFLFSKKRQKTYSTISPNVLFSFSGTVLLQHSH